MKNREKSAQFPSCEFFPQFANRHHNNSTKQPYITVAQKTNSREYWKEK